MEFVSNVTFNLCRVARMNLCADPLNAQLRIKIYNFTYRTIPFKLHCGRIKVKSQFTKLKVRLANFIYISTILSNYVLLGCFVTEIPFVIKTVLYNYMYSCK